MESKNIFYITKEAWKLAWKFQRKSFVWYLIISILSGSVVLLSFGSFALIVNKVINFLSVHPGVHLSTLQALRYFGWSFALLGASYLIPAALGQWQANYGTVFTETFMTSITAHFAKKQSELDAAVIESPTYQNKIQQGNEWGRGSLAAITNLTINSIGSLVSVIVACIALAIVKWWFVIIALISAVPVYFIQQIFQREIFRIRKLATEGRRIIGNRIGMFSAPTTLIEIVMFGSTQKYQDELTHLMNEEDKKIITIRLQQTIWQNFSRLFSVLCIIAISVVIVTEGINGAIPIALMIFVFSAYGSFYSSAINLFSQFATAQDSARYALIWLELFETKPSITSKENAIALPMERPPRIEFVNVSFTYPESKTPAITNINVVIEPGEKVGIVGLSGAGKTTFIKLLSRIYDPSEGQILVDGHDLRDIDLKSWQQLLGVMHQNFANYNLSVKESIAIGDLSKPIDIDRVCWAAEMAGAKTFIEKLPKKYDQLIWKGFKDGADLSGGEKQRLAIARIFYRGAQISILDEPTSSVDALTASMIFENLETKTKNETVFLISHNFSTVKQSTKILVIEHGTILEQGNHDELYKLKGRYAELYDLQANAFTE